MSSAWWVPLVNHLIEVVGSILGIVLTALAMKAFQRLGLNVTADKQGMYDKAISTGIGSAEEWAHKKVTSFGAGAAPSSEEKLQKGVAVALEEIDALGLEKKSEAWVKERLHALMGLNRGPALSVGTLLSTSSNPPPPSA